MTADELRAWALGNGWTMVGGYPSLTKPSNPKEAVVRMVLKATVVHVEAKKPAGKWEKLSGDAYAKVTADPETGVPGGLGFEKLPGFRMLMRENRDRQVFAGWGGDDPASSPGGGGSRIIPVPRAASAPPPGGRTP